MICPKCGRNIPDGSICPCSYNTPTLSSNPAVNLLKTLGSSTLFLVVTILLSAAPLLSILSQISARSGMSDLYYLAMELDLDPSIFYPFMDALNGASVAGIIFSCTPAILIAVAMWITWSSSRNTMSGNVSTAGLTICKVLSIIGLVCICIGAAAVLLVLVVGMVAGFAEIFEDASYYYGDGVGEAAMAILVVIFLVLAAIFTLAILYEICVVKTINRIKATATTGVPDNRIPNYLIVMNYIVAAVSVLAGLGSIFNNPLSGLSSLLSAATLVLISIILTRCRSGMTLLMYPPVQPAYPQQTMPPQNPWG